ncbi:PH domain-containing protein [Cellulomonas marina]|uniref:PH domain-containing protein n=1 Tax=Cellulomonas marina TaxID=988821 RepID=A0A1I0ZIL5_9CELL|nr:PH domain-containing protein [Cellulomonas marina]GIG28596.1 hypothetical protein Cma02nite_11960 [Cellulomonas marina]SFB25202.1 PH domain-containing protein [Cellulomonas marina]
MSDDPAPVHVARSAYGRALVVAVVLVVLVALVAVAADDPGGLRVASAWAAWAVLAAWALFWRPALEVGDERVVVRNVLATVVVPRGALRAVRGRWGLELVTDGGVVPVWAAPGSAALGSASGRRGPADEGAALLDPLVGPPAADVAAPPVTRRVHTATVVGLVGLPVLAVLLGATA